jgi:hypothetical protein
VNGRLNLAIVISMYIERWDQQIARSKLNVCFFSTKGYNNNNNNNNNYNNNNNNDLIAFPHSGSSMLQVSLIIR